MPAKHKHWLDQMYDGGYETYPEPEIELKAPQPVQPKPQKQTPKRKRKKPTQVKSNENQDELEKKIRELIKKYNVTSEKDLKNQVSIDEFAILNEDGAGDIFEDIFGKKKSKKDEDYNGDDDDIDDEGDDYKEYMSVEYIFDLPISEKEKIKLLIENDYIREDNKKDDHFYKQYSTDINITGNQLSALGIDYNIRYSPGDGDCMYHSVLNASKEN